MFIKNIENQKRFLKAAGLLFSAAAVLMFSGCALIGTLVSPTDYEKRVPAAYDLGKHKEDTLYLVVHAASASGSDLDLPVRLSDAVAELLALKVKIPRAQILKEAGGAGYADPLAGADLTAEQRALKAGADLLLYVEIREYELFNVHGKDYYMGHLITQSVLTRPETNEKLWPKEGTGRRVESAVELETKGRLPALSRLTAATAHCIVRELTATPKSGYRSADERRSVDDLIKELE